MTATQPPGAATWLLQRLGPVSNRESLAGDLVEQYSNGRSRAWYWRQVLSAVVVGIATDLRDQPLLALRALVLTWMIVIPWVEATWALYLWASDKWVYGWVNRSYVLFEFWIPFGGGLSLLWCLSSALSGWVIAGISARNRVAMVAASVLAQLPLMLWWSSPVWLLQSGRGPVNLWLSNWLWAGAVLIGMPACTLIGGLRRFDIRT